ncbi:MAG: FAD-dependent oxidoreductase, partial [Pygmaiobacter sp.]
IFQIYHPGQVQYQETRPKTINELTVEELRVIQDKYAAAARRAFLAGADGVDVHMAHTYLLCQFLSPYFNHRTDQYGCATAEQSLCFALECIKKIRKVTPPDFILTTKINARDFVEGGMMPGRAAKIAALLEQAGIAMITVSGGGNQTDITGMSADGNRMEGWKVADCKKIKQAVSIPVAASGSIRHPWFVERCLAEGACDVVSMGRTLLAEPHWIQKVREGRENELRYCISCLHCLNDTKPGVPGCSVNPLCCMETEHFELHNNGDGRSVVVVGAGPAGLECAITLAQRKFAVTIYEREQEIGGMMTLAAVPPGKQKLRWMLDFYRKQIDVLGIRLVLAHTVSAEELAAEHPCAVVVASGSNAWFPPIPGIDHANVCSVRDILRERSTLCNRKIAVLGGGLTGLECARMLSRQGNFVTVLEMAQEPQTPSLEVKLARRYALEDGVVLRYNHRVTEIKDNTVQAVDTASQQTVSVPADNVIVSLGVRPENNLYRELSAQLAHVYQVGDCAEIGKIMTAISAGSRLGYELEL